MSLPRFSTRRPVAIAMLFLAIALLGVISWTRLPIDLLPDISYPKLVVYNHLGGSHPFETSKQKCSADFYQRFRVGRRLEEVLE